MGKGGKERGRLSRSCLQRILVTFYQGGHTFVFIVKSSNIWFNNCLNICLNNCIKYMLQQLLEYLHIDSRGEQDEFVDEVEDLLEAQSIIAGDRMPRWKNYSCVILSHMCTKSSQHVLRIDIARIAKLPYMAKKGLIKERLFWKKGFHVEKVPTVKSLCKLSVFYKLSALPA